MLQPIFEKLASLSDTVVARVQPGACNERTEKECEKNVVALSTTSSAALPFTMDVIPSVVFAIFKCFLGRKGWVLVN